jgi:hypothetical protein
MPEEKKPIATHEEIQKWILQAAIFGIVGWTLNKIFLSKLDDPNR